MCQLKRYKIPCYGWLGQPSQAAELERLGVRNDRSDHEFQHYGRHSRTFSPVGTGAASSGTFATSDA